MRIATFNVAGLPSSLAPLRRRVPHFCRYLDEAAVDVVNFQEVWAPGVLRAVRSHLPGFPHVARRGGGLATLSRHPITTVRYTSFRRATAKGLGQWVNTRLQGVLVMSVAGLELGNTHLTANRAGDWSATGRSFELQRTQLALLHEAAAGCAVLTGDFNVAASGPLYPAVVGAFADPFAATDPPTFHEELLPPGRVAQRIDYALVRGLPVIGQATLFERPEPGLGYLSDHLALTVDVEV